MNRRSDYVLRSRAAELAGISKQLMQRMVKRGEYDVPEIVVEGTVGRIFFAASREAVDKWIKARGGKVARKPARKRAS